MLNNLERYKVARFCYHIGYEYMTDSEFRILEEVIRDEYPESEYLTRHYSEDPCPKEELKKENLEHLIDKITVKISTPGMPSITKDTQVEYRLSLSDGFKVRASFKMDGFNIGAQYYNGKLVQILSHGTAGNKQKLDFLEEIIPRFIPMTGEVYVAGELVLPNDQWLRLKAEENLTSQRNSIATVIAKRDVSYVEYFAFALYVNKKKQTDIFNVYNKLKSFGFKVPPNVIFEKVTEGLRVIDKLSKTNFARSYPTDGIVFETEHNEQFAARVGYWEEKDMISYIESFSESPGLFKTTPIANIHPVTYNNRNFTKVGLYNPEVIRKLRLKVGSPIAFTLRSHATVVINREQTMLLERQYPDLRAYQEMIDRG